MSRPWLAALVALVGATLALWSFVTGAAPASLSFAQANPTLESRAFAPQLARDEPLAPLATPTASPTKAGPTATRTPTTIPPTATRTPTTVPSATHTPTPASGPHTWYTSSHPSADYYYCDLDDGWKNLSPQYLRSYASEQALLADWAGKRVKHPESKC